MTILELIEAGAQQLIDSGVAFGHGTSNAFDEAAWLVLWQLGLPLDSPLEGTENEPELVTNRAVSPVERAQVAALLEARITSRKPAAYLTHEAWLQGVAFYVDERVIVPRSFIAELLVNGAIDPWLDAATPRDDEESTLRNDKESTLRVLDLCTGNGSLAVLAAMEYPDVDVTAADLSLEALAVARINIDKHRLQPRITLLLSDGLSSTELQSRGPFDLILCNPPYVNAQSMAALPPEYHAEPALALDGNMQGGSDGMDFIRSLLRDAPAQMTPDAVLVLEIGNEREHFEAAFATLETVWLDTSAGEDQVLLLTREALLKC